MYSISYCVTCADCRKTHQRTFENLTAAEAAEKFYQCCIKFDEEQIEMGVVEAIKSSKHTVAVATKTLESESFTLGVFDAAFLTELDLQEAA